MVNAIHKSQIVASELIVVFLRDYVFIFRVIKSLVYSVTQRQINVWTSLALTLLSL